MAGTEPEDARFEERLRAAEERRRRADGAGRSEGVPGGALVAGLRVGAELVAALAVALAIGWGLDRWLGTAPWLMVAMFPLGAAAGVVNVWRAFRREGS